MHTEMNLEEMKQFFLESTDEEFEEKAEFIHPVDILDVLHEIEEEVSQKYKDYGTTDKEVRVLKELLKLQKGHINNIALKESLLWGIINKLS